MLSKKLILISGLLAATATVPAASSLAAGHSTTLASPSDITIQKAYAYDDSFPPQNKRTIEVVVKTAGQLPRRFDGLIRAGATVDGAGGGSIGSVGGKATRCYVFALPLRDGRLIPQGDPGKKGPKASYGSRHTVTLSAKTADGTTVTSKKSFTIHKRHAGDRAGAPAGC